ncbi:TPA: DUF3884 family protein [Enterococcus faecalis]|uniref:DUF3884 family protein n=1 Tax=Enterococcus TaxID=1350 RepID=UPI00032DF2D2|nr:DUF3884 family protein [Enterococcus faecalis]BDH65013.1 hypothetical protein MTP05_11980 [Enterococcus sp. PLM3]EGO2585826.1 DUF3884 family protein [Enterococcus faecalis]EGO5111267.1 DUF3884 family protein [Enterococcus faecalis]EGO5851282.1 DUF3884 family protein [Enterococcus faecalis]EGO6073996.1 DUF3884 family protein [Enterococcus faecalis]
MKILTPVYQIKFKKVPNQLLIDERLMNELGTWLNRTGRIWVCQSSKSAKEFKNKFYESTGLSANEVYISAETDGLFRLAENKASD